MHSAASRQVDNVLVGDENRPGQVLTGMDIRQTVQLLWPDIHQHSMILAASAIRRYLAANNTVRCIRATRHKSQGGNAALSEWWVANEWETDMSGHAAAQRLASQRHARHVKGDHSMCLPNRPCRKPVKITPAIMPAHVPVSPPADPVEDLAAPPDTDTATNPPAASTEPTPVDALRVMANGHADDPFVLALIDFATAALHARSAWENENRTLRRKLMAVRSAFAELGDIE
jgi:hypothetical protein